MRGKGGRRVVNSGFVEILPGTSHIGIMAEAELLAASSRRFSTTPGRAHAAK
jgi:hypothetical protein